MTTSLKTCAFTRARWLALVAIGSISTAIVLAHEGHAPLPTRGVQIDLNKGQLLLAADAVVGLGVDTAVVEPRTIEERITAYATIAAPWQNHGFATSKLPGRISQVHITPGQNVSAGDPIAEIESFELDNLQQELLTARNNIRLSEKLITELNKAAQSGVTPEQTLLDAENKLAQERNVLEVNKAKWIGLGLPKDLLGDLLNRGASIPRLTLTVRSPVPGTVFHAELSAGKSVEPIDHLAEVIDLSTVWVKIGILEKDIRKVKVGQEVEVRLIAYREEPFHTSIQAITPFLDPITHIATVWVELKNSSFGEPRFRPGMTGLASVLVARKTTPATVPTDALVREGAERFVLVEDAKTARGSEYHKKAVTPGNERGGKVELLQGAVFPGDRVVTRGANFLGTLFAPQTLKLSPEAERTISLKIEPVQSHAIDDVIAIDSTVDIQPAQRGVATSQLSGTIQVIRADRGQQVKAGEVLMELYSPELLNMQQELLRVHLETKLTTETLARLRQSPGIASRRVWELESLENELKSRSETFQHKLLRAGLTSEHVARLISNGEIQTSLPIRAPISGAIVNFDKALGQAVSPQELLFVIHDFSHPLVRAQVSERDSARVLIGLPARIRLIADPKMVVNGRVARSANNVSLSSRSLSVWIELEETPGEPLLNNQLASTVVAVSSKAPTIAVPRTAIATEGAGSFVFVRKNDGTFDRRRVETGDSDDRWIAITKGLSLEELIAVSGIPELMTTYASLR